MSDHANGESRSLDARKISTSSQTVFRLVAEAGRIVSARASARNVQGRLRAFLDRRAWLCSGRYDVRRNHASIFSVQVASRFGSDRCGFDSILGARTTSFHAPDVAQGSAGSCYVRVCFIYHPRHGGHYDRVYRWSNQRTFAKSSVKSIRRIPRAKQALP